MGCIVCAFVQTALSVALVPIMSEMKVAASVAQWLTSTYSLVMGIMVLAAAFLIRRFPAKPLFLVDMAIFMAGLLLSAVADDFYMLLAGRLLQAVACGILLSLTQVVVLTIYPKNRLGTVMGTFGLAVTAAPVLAPTLAGVMIDLASWRLIFWISLGLSAVILVSGIFLMANVTATQKQRFDFLSMLLCSVGLTGPVDRSGAVRQLPLDAYSGLAADHKLDSGFNTFCHSPEKAGQAADRFADFLEPGLPSGCHRQHGHVRRTVGGRDPGSPLHAVAAWLFSDTGWPSDHARRAGHRLLQLDCRPGFMTGLASGKSHSAGHCFCF